MRTTITDVYEGSFLLAHNVKLAEVLVDRGRRRQTVVFAFEGGDEVADLQRSYHSGTAYVNLCLYRQCLNNIRQSLRQALAKKPARSRAVIQGTPRYETTGNQAANRPC